MNDDERQLIASLEAQEQRLVFDRFDNAVRGGWATRWSRPRSSDRYRSRSTSAATASNCFMPRSRAPRPRTTLVSSARSTSWTGSPKPRISSAAGSRPPGPNSTRPRRRASLFRGAWRRLSDPHPRRRRYRHDHRLRPTPGPGPRLCDRDDRNVSSTSETLSSGHSAPLSPNSAFPCPRCFSSLAAVSAATST